MSFGETDHGFKLSGRGCDTAFCSADVFAEFAHFDVGCDEFFGGFGADAGLALCAGVRDVGRKELDGLEQVSDS